MTPDVFDKDGARRDWDWLRSNYGNVQFLDAGAGAKFRLARVDVTEGPATLKARVLGADGTPHASQPVANHWPDPTLPDLRNAGLKTLWQDRAVWQNTEPNGFTGFGLGPGSYIRDLGAGGPHTVWVLSPSLPSDGISGLGMLGGTNHEGPLFLTFQIADGEPVTPEQPAPDLDRLLRLCEVMMVSSWTPEQIVGRAEQVLTLAIEATERV